HQARVGGVPQDGLATGIPGEDPRRVREHETLRPQIAAHGEQPVLSLLDGGKYEPAVEAVDRHQARQASGSWTGSSALFAPPSSRIQVSKLFSPSRSRITRAPRG